MKTFTFAGGSLVAGLVLQSDEKLGNVVFLGEEGRGRRFEKVGLYRKNPAVVTEPEAPVSRFAFGTPAKKVMEAEPVQIVLNKGQQNEKSFYTLGKPEGETQKILVRIKTMGVYTRGTSGSWSTLKGQPQDLIKAYGARGDAGRIGSWDDGLVVMNPGDVIRVKLEGGSKNKPYALVYGEKGLVAMSLSDYEALSAQDAEEAVVVKVSETPASVVVEDRKIEILASLLEKLIATCGDAKVAEEAKTLLNPVEKQVEKKEEDNNLSPKAISYLSSKLNRAAELLDMEDEL